MVSSPYHKRHSHASLLLKNIHPKVVQERLGHSSITMTLDLYSHLTRGLQKEAADVLGDIYKEEETPHMNPNYRKDNR